jgi:hypothetical protein
MDFELGWKGRGPGSRGIGEQCPKGSGRDCGALLTLRVVGLQIKRSPLPCNHGRIPQEDRTDAGAKF